MSAPMNMEEAAKIAKEMTYRDAVVNALRGRCVPFKKATRIKLKELLEIVENMESEENNPYKEIFIDMFNHIKRVHDHYLQKNKALTHDEQITYGNYITLFNACVNALIGKEIKEIYLGENENEH